MPTLLNEVEDIDFHVKVGFLGFDLLLPDISRLGCYSTQHFERRLKSFDRNVLVGGAVFGVGWGLSGICPGTAYASLGIGNITILWALAGMFIGAYLQGYWRTRSETRETATTSAD